MINYNHLYYFYMTAKLGAVTAAARALRTSQPSLTTQIKTLERELNRRLFFKSGRNILLTDEGRAVFGYCRKIFDVAEDLEASLASKGEENLRIHLGVSDEIERPFAVEVVSRLGRARSKTPPLVTMTSDSHARLLVRLKSNELDAVITHQAPIEEGVIPLVSVKMPVLLAYQASGRQRDFAALRGANSVARIRKMPTHTRWALPHQKLKLRSEIDLFMEGQVSGRVIFESDVLAAVVRAVADGIGVAFLPLPYIKTEIAHGKIAVAGPKRGFWEHGIWLLSTRRHREDPVLTALKSAFELAATGSGMRNLATARASSKSRRDPGPANSAGRNPPPKRSSRR